MKAIFFIWLVGLLPVSAQVVAVKVIPGKDTTSTEWKILDEQMRSVLIMTENYKMDTITFSLNANTIYFLQISVDETQDTDTSLFSLLINGESILQINSDITTGDHFFRFFTGIKDPVTKITGGSTAKIYDFPWQVYFVSANQRCGGSIISPEWIVTAAHCTKNSSGAQISPASMYIRAGTNNPNDLNSGKTYMVGEVIVHERYNSTTNDNDIALLKLKVPVNIENARPVKLITPEDSTWGYTDPGVMAWISGWGMTSVSPETFPNYLQKAQVPIVSNALASVVWKNIAKSNLMAGYRDGNKDACMGDSGGPLVVSAGSEFKLAGIVSWGSDKCNTYGAYTRVSSFESWIRQKTGIQTGYIIPPPVGDTVICKGETSSIFSMKFVPEATKYEWVIYPTEAGNVIGDQDNAAVFWNSAYTGKATLMLRITVNEKVSEWSSLNIVIARHALLISQSEDFTLCNGESARLFVTAAGYNLFYKWYKNGEVLQAGRWNELYISGSSIFDAGIYQCEILGSCGSITSVPINVIVHPLTRITNIPSDLVVPFGEDTVVEVVSLGHDLMYEWFQEEKLLEYSNSSQLLLENVNAGNIGLYKVKVTGTCGEEISDQIYLYVNKENSSEETEVFVWPTITSNEFKVALSNDQYYNVSLFEINGRFIKELKKCRYQTSVNVEMFLPGMYIVNVYNRNFRISHKIIKN